ncbi:Zn(II)2Cys6 transcription factor domain-containing protein [Aspergillus novofumigatus IBT 16806]|uniref:Zn(2)-C6 fungal-type domain-containing protein n=1 Tax=Aspergillus novofumigatus (strain IBT 16806) TaxID=1392255 RepID=A0A2I1BS43_ASPN1|nr:uncharacterized protein P174DRAFT_465307 [Aspergillus novofumigatus IBT 16806]PKX88215.1 hypothetical protein P174DRAFT_465307 [Aspergillus novofumigatus IBT 16806]
MLKLEEHASSTRRDLQFDSLVSPTNSKVAIPRIVRPQPRNAIRRAKRACLECRHRKTRCDGYQPCHQCDFFNVACEYAEGKQERAKRRVVELEEQIGVDAQDREMIDRVLNRVFGAGKPIVWEQEGQYRNNRQVNQIWLIAINMEHQSGEKIQVLASLAEAA